MAGPQPEVQATQLLNKLSGQLQRLSRFFRLEISMVLKGITQSRINHGANGAMARGHLPREPPAIDAIFSWVFLSTL
jgi:hypothetical protein